MIKKIVSVAIATSLLASVQTAGGTSTMPDSVTVLYDDSFQNGVSYNRWNGTNNVAASSPVKMGERSIQTKPDGWAGIFIDLPDGLRTRSATTLRFWLHGGSSGSGSFVLRSKQLVDRDVGLFVIPPVPANTWTRFEVPMAQLGGAAFDSMTGRSFWFADGSGSAHPDLYLDQIELVNSTTRPSSTILPPTTATTTVPATTTVRMPVSTTISPNSGTCPTGFACDNFEWSGDHAASVAGGAGRTVWWNPDRWDVRHDFAYDSQDSHAHVDIHKAASHSAHNGHEDNTDSTTNGVSGVPGVGIMRVHETAIASARLRTPIVINASRPAVVRFQASRYVTGGHWWEVALTPDITGAEHTAIPSQSTGMAGAIAGSGNSRGGPGHANPTDSINVVVSGWPDDCSNATYVAVRQTVNKVTKDFVNQKSAISQLTKISPSEKEELYPWEVRFWPNRTEVALDNDRNGTYETVQSFAVTVPWPKAYVHLVTVAYHAQVHPPAPCNQGQDREMAWKDVQAGPIADAQTAVFPRENGTDNVPRRTGWMLTDGRDVQRFGTVGALPQANPSKYDNYGPVLLCSAETQLSVQYCPNRVPSAQLQVDLPELGKVTSARFVYDIIRLPAEGQASLSVNGVFVGTLPKGSSVSAALADHWTRRSIDIPLSALRPGSNTVTISLRGDVRIDRLQIELSSSK